MSKANPSTPVNQDSYPLFNSRGDVTTDDHIPGLQVRTEEVDRNSEMDMTDVLNEIYGDFINEGDEVDIQTFTPYGNRLPSPGQGPSQPGMSIPPLQPIATTETTSVASEVAGHSGHAEPVKAASNDAGSTLSATAAGDEPAKAASDAATSTEALSSTAAAAEPARAASDAAEPMEAPSSTPAGAEPARAASLAPTSTEAPLIDSSTTTPPSSETLPENPQGQASVAHKPQTRASIRSAVAVPSDGGSSTAVPSGQKLVASSIAGPSRNAQLLERQGSADRSRSRTPATDIDASRPIPRVASDKRASVPKLKRNIVDLSRTEQPTKRPRTDVGPSPLGSNTVGVMFFYASPTLINICSCAICVGVLQPH